jgi:BirA family biotin operon repressor/biotin-[acetyl-CoA-carboxylase] ligase
MKKAWDLGPDLEDAADRIAARGGRLGKPLRLLSETGSTNDDAKVGAREGAPHGATWVAESQEHGRGRQGRQWTSPRGENLLFSVLLRIACLPSRVPQLSLVCGLAVRDAAARAIGDDRRVLVKWPNDVVVLPREGKGRGFRKIAGVLIESSLSGSKVDHLIVGVGLNVHTRTFPKELAATATSIALETDRVPNRAEILADVLWTIDHDIEHVAAYGLGLVHGRLSKYDALLGREIENDDGLAGVARGIDTEGRLLVERADGSVVKVSSGEVRVRVV